MAKPNVKVYSTPSCPWCTVAKDFLKKHKVEFEEVDVSVDDGAALEMETKSGQNGVPVIDINGKVIVGYDEQALRKLLKIA
ncbi:MAG: glutaredoxin domain-containing protein, partial [Nanoarchaeota archaeon]